MNFDRRASQSTNGCLANGRTAPSLLGEKGEISTNHDTFTMPPSDRGGEIHSNVFGINYMVA